MGTLVYRVIMWLLASLLLILALQPLFAQELPGDLIELTGRQLPRLLGVPVDEVTALAAHSGALVPVHVQVDQRARVADGTWHYAFEAGEEPRPAKDRRLASDDALLLALAEAGDQLRPVPGDAVEIEVTPTHGGDSVWFYLRRGEPPQLAPLITYESAADRIRGQSYALRFSRSGTAVLDSLVLGDGPDAADILDRNKARLDIDLALGIGTVSRSEDDVHVRTTGLHVGPLRIIRESEVRGRLLLGLYSAPVRDNFIFYAHGFVLPTTIRLMPSVRMLIRTVTLRISMDLNDAAGTLTFQSAPEIPSAIPIDGCGGQLGGHEPISWYLIRRANAGLLGWLEARPDVAREVALYYRDEHGHRDAPERFPGEFGDHGFLYRHTGPLPSGEVRLISHAWILQGDELRAPADWLRGFATRPSVQVH